MAPLHGVCLLFSCFVVQTTSSMSNSILTPTMNYTSTLSHEGEIDITNETGHIDASDDNDTVNTTAKFHLALNITVPYCEGSLCGENKPFAKNCYCDESCFFYNDCCYTMIDKLSDTTNDTRALVEAVKEKVKGSENKTLMMTRELISCIGNVINTSTYFMVIGCDLTGNGVKDYKDRCEDSTDFYNENTIPVDHIVNDEVVATFKNVYCALCNNIPVTELHFWEAGIKCNRTDLNAIAKLSLEEIAILPGCKVNIRSAFENKIRRCLKNLPIKKECQNNDSEEMNILCNTYIYPISTVYPNYADITATTYRNPHCAMCGENAINSTVINCNDAGDEFISEIITIDFHVVFNLDINGEMKSEVKCKKQVTCKPYEVYDCVSLKCRQLYCHVGATPVNGECISYVSVSNYQLANSTRPLGPFEDTINAHGIYTLIIEVFYGKELNETMFILVMTLEDLLDNIHASLYEHFIVSKREGCVCIELVTLEEITVSFVVDKVFPKLVNHFEILGEGGHLVYSNVLPFIRIRNFYSLNTLNCSSGQLFIDRQPHIVEFNSSSNVGFVLATAGLLVTSKTCGWQLGFNKDDGIQPTLVATCMQESLRVPNLNCSMVSLGLNELIINNDSVIVINSGLTVNEDQFAVFQNRVFICSEFVTSNMNIMDFFQYKSAYNMLSVVTSFVSVFSALVIISVHCCLKRLRNIHGLNLTAMSVSLLIMHVLLIISVFKTTGLACTIYAISLHFILLNTFVWMNIIGFDMARIFLSDNILIHDSPFKRFICHIFVSVLLPCVLVGVSFGFDFTSLSIKPGYGDNDICWLTGKKSILVFVIAPVLFSMLLNFLFFVSTVLAICNKTRKTKYVRKSDNMSYFVVYLKMYIILGLTWILGIVAAFIDLEWVWILHVLLNGLQGLSLLICTVVNARNIRRLREIVKKQTENATVLVQRL